MLRGKDIQKRLDHVKQSVTDALKTASKRPIQKTAEATGDLIANKIADKITKVLRTFPQNSSKTFTNKVQNIEHDKEIPKERYISSKDEK